MEIKNINFLNLDTLYQIVVDKFYDTNYDKIKFGRNLPQLLNHIVITLELSSVSEYEYLYLKMYSTSITKMNDKRYDINYIQKNYPEVYDSTLKLLTLFSTIDQEKDTKARSLDMDSYFTPAGMIIGDCIVTLSGSQLASIISLEPRDFFIKASNNKCVIVNEDPTKNKLDPDYKSQIYTDESVKNFIISEFITGFYKFLTEKATFIDLASDSFNCGKFLSLNNTKKVKMMNLRNPYVMCEFNEDDPSVIISNLNRYKELNFPKKFTINNTYFEFSVRSDFGTFFELMNILPYEKFICLENLNMPAIDTSEISNIPECPDIWKEKYENRYKGRMSGLITDINDKYYRTNDTAIKKLEMTQNYVLYSYSLLLSLHDIDECLNPYLKEYEDSKDYIVNNTKTTINEIIKYSLAIFKSM